MLQLPGMRSQAVSLRQGRAGCRPPARPVALRNVRAAAAGGDKGGEGLGDRKPSRRRTNSNNGGEEVPPPSPAVQAANNLASKASSSSSSSTTPPSPATQVANNLAASSPAADPSGRSSSTSQGSSSSSGGAGAPASSPADLLQQGIRGAANATEEAIAQAAGAAVGGIEAASSLSQQGLAAAEAAAEQAARGLSDAATGGLNAAATAVGGTAGALDGVAAAARGDTPRSRQPRGSSNGAPAASSGDFDTVSVRVPASAWANATREKGRVRDMTLTQDFDEDEVEQLKVQILAAVASLDRGLAANVREARDVDSLARKLEDAAGPVALGWKTSRSSPNQSTMDKLAGTWRLIYSSGFNGGSLGGSRPGPPAAFTPTVLGQIYQVIDAQAMTLDNVVELLLQYGLPRLPFLSPAEPEPTPGVRATLRHTYEVSPPSSVKIVFESTAVKAIGPELLQSLPQFGLPELPSFLKPPKDFRSATFNVTFLDAGMRVTRGDRGELRIYLKDTPLERKLPIDDD